MYQQSKCKPTAYKLVRLQPTCAIARCLIKAHDVLGYISLSQMSDEKRSSCVMI